MHKIDNGCTLNFLYKTLNTIQYKSKIFDLLLVRESVIELLVVHLLYYSIIWY